MDEGISGGTVGFVEAGELIMATKSAVLAADDQIMNQTSHRFSNFSDNEYCSWLSDVYVPGAASTGGMIFRREDPIRDIFRYKYENFNPRCSHGVRATCSKSAQIIVYVDS